MNNRKLTYKFENGALTVRSEEDRVIARQMGEVLWHDVLVDDGEMQDRHSFVDAIKDIAFKNWLVYSNI